MTTFSKNKKAMKKPTYKHLLDIENRQIRQLNEIVLKAIEEEKLIAEKLIDQDEKNLPLSSRVADRVAEFGGSWKFIILFGVGMLIWISLNVVWFRNQGFDPYPFILLNLILSCVAAMQAPIIMMSQNRQEEKDRKRSENDYLINLKSEIELRNLHQKIDLLIVEEMRTLFETQKAQLDILSSIESKLKILERK